MLAEFTRRTSHPEDFSNVEWLRMIAEDQRLSTDSTPTPVEAYLSLLPRLAQDNEAILDAIYSEVLIREVRGQKTTSEEFIRRFPNLVIEIRRQFQLHTALAIGSSSNTVVGGDSTDGPGKGAGE